MAPVNAYSLTSWPCAACSVACLWTVGSPAIGASFRRSPRAEGILLSVGGLRQCVNGVFLCGNTAKPAESIAGKWHHRGTMCHYGLQYLRKDAPVCIRYGMFRIRADPAGANSNVSPERPPCGCHSYRRLDGSGASGCEGLACVYHFRTHYPELI